MLLVIISLRILFSSGSRKIFAAIAVCQLCSLIAITGFIKYAEAGQVEYEIRYLGNNFTPKDINDKGQIVGRRYGYSTRAELYDGTSFRFDFNPSLSAINNNGRIVGAYRNWSNNIYQDIGFYVNYPENILKDVILPWQVSGQATAVNNHGRIVGFGLDASSNREAFQLINDVPYKLSLDSEIVAETAVGINDNFTIIGSYSAEDGTSRPYIHFATGSTDYIEDLPDMPSEAVAINDPLSGDEQVIGWYEDSSAFKKGFVYQAPLLNYISPIEGDEIIPTDINNAGKVIGKSSYLTSEGQTQWRAFILDSAQDDAVPVYLDSKVDLPEEWALDEAIAINSRGEIIGQGTFKGSPGSAFLLSPYPAYEQIEYLALRRSTPTPDEKLGDAVAISNGVIAIAAPGRKIYDEEQLHVKTGAIDLYQLIDRQWQRVSELTTPDNVHNGFGQSLAMHNDTLVVGAPLDDEGGVDVGAAYVFNKQDNGSWVFKQKVLPQVSAEENLANARFGNSLAVHNKTLVVGAPKYSYATSSRVYIFNQEDVNSWLQTQVLLPDSTNLSFGKSVDVDENYIVIGAPNEGWGLSGVGRVFIYKNTISNEWITDKSLYRSNNQFGWSVQSDKDLMFIAGAGYGYLYRRKSDGTWASIDRLSINSSGEFGKSVALDANNLIIGDPNQNTFSVIQRSGLYWAHRKDVRFDKAVSGDAFGNAVAVDGNTIVIGQPSRTVGGHSKAGMAYVYQLCVENCVAEYSADLSIDVTTTDVTVTETVPISISLTNLDSSNAAIAVDVKTLVPPEFGVPANEDCEFYSALHEMICFRESISSGETTTFELNLGAPSSPGVYEMEFCTQATSLDLDGANNCQLVQINVGHRGEPSVTIFQPAADSEIAVFKEDPIPLIVDIKSWIVRPNDSYYRVYINDLLISRYDKQAFDISEYVEEGNNPVRVALTDINDTETNFEDSVTFNVSYKVPCIAFNAHETTLSIVRQLEDEILLDYSLCYWQLTSGGKHVDMYVDDEYYQTLDSYQAIDISHFNDGNFDITLRLAEGMEGDAGHIQRIEHDTINIDLTTLLPEVNIIAPGGNDDPIVVGPNNSLSFSFDIKNYTMLEGGKHFRWYLDGVERGIGYKPGTIEIGHEGLPTGEHTLALTLVSSDNQPIEYGSQVRFSVLQQLPTVNITEPVQQQVLRNEAEMVSVVYSITHSEQILDGSQLQLFINGNEYQSLAMNQSIVEVSIDHFNIDQDYQNSIEIKLLGPDAALVAESSVNEIMFGDSRPIVNPEVSESDSGGGSVSWLLLQMLFMKVLVNMRLPRRKRHASQ